MNIHFARGLDLEWPPCWKEKNGGNLHAPGRSPKKINIFVIIYINYFFGFELSLGIIHNYYFRSMFDSLESPLDALIRPDRENPQQQQQSSQQQQQQAVHHIWIDGIQV